MKVFSKEKFYADADLTSELRERERGVGWPEECDGKTKEECNALGYWVSSDWMEERRVKVFSREKYFSVMDKNVPSGAERRREFVWPFECEGKTEEECIALGYVVSPNWMEDR